ncbi:cupin domain-containing protein [Paenibacillus koleovorans]|uniref:cupin domain-containing protein n=1 Tax=Paenibacillus koleovorans TaxID=121608 RepID=UPI000FDCB955|nr:cupin domain-containing protein [Paenibacillus koleovorans]
MFIQSSAIPFVTLEPGLERRILGYSEQMMVTEVRFAKGVVGVLHHHPHRQSAYVAAGSFEVTIDGETKVLVTGDGYMVEPDIVHGVVALEDGSVLIDFFTPMREDFLK